MSINFPSALKAVGGAHTGIAPVNLLDVQDVNGNLYYWSDRRCNVPIAISGALNVNASLPVAPASGQYVTWTFPGSVGLSNMQPNIVASKVSTQSGRLTAVGNQLGEEIGGTITWSNFAAPSLPPGAVIDAIYPVAIVAYDGAVPYMGTFPKPSSSQGQSNLGSIGTTAAAITAWQPVLQIGASAPGPYPDWVEYDFIGLAVYYHLNTSAGSGSGSNGASAPYKPWLLSVPSFTFHRSLVTDIGSFTIQNISGDTLSRDMEKLLRASALEGAFFVYRLWQPDAQAAWLEVHGQLTVADDGVDTITLKGEQLINASQDDTPLEIYCETCQIQWGGKRCGSTQTTECLYSMQTCQVVERIMVDTNNYEKNFGECTANTALNVINRRRRI